MRSTFRVLFYLKKGAPLKNGMLPIMVRITIDGEKVEFSTKLEIEEKKWDIKSAPNARGGRTNSPARTPYGQMPDSAP